MMEQETLRLNRAWALTTAIIVIVGFASMIAAGRQVAQTQRMCIQARGNWVEGACVFGDRE